MLVSKKVVLFSLMVDKSHHCFNGSTSFQIHPGNLERALFDATDYLPSNSFRPKLKDPFGFFPLVLKHCAQGSEREGSSED